MKNKKLLVISSMMCAGVLVGCGKENTHVLSELIVSFPAERFQKDQTLLLSEVKVYALYKDGTNTLLNNKNVTFSDFVEDSKSGSKIYTFKDTDVEAGMKAFTATYKEGDIELTKELSVGVDNFFLTDANEVSSKLDSMDKVKPTLIKKVDFDINFTLDTTGIDEEEGYKYTVDQINNLLITPVLLNLIQGKSDDTELKKKVTGVFDEEKHLLVFQSKPQSHNNDGKKTSSINDNADLNFNSVFGYFDGYNPYFGTEGNHTFIDSKSTDGFVASSDFFRLNQEDKNGTWSMIKSANTFHFKNGLIDCININFVDSPLNHYEPIYEEERCENPLNGYITISFTY